MSLKPPGNGPSNEAPKRHRARASGRVWLLLFLAGYAGLGSAAAYRLGLTTDEPIHLGVGYCVLTEREYRLDRIHPPLARVWVALPLLFQQVNPPQLRNQDLGIKRFWRPLQDWVQVLNPVDRMLRWSRRMNLLLGAALIVMVWVVLRRRDPLAAVIGAGMLAFSPSILAHASLATTDMAVILMYPLAGLAVWWALHTPTPARVVLAGLAAGVALASKYTAILLLPLGLLMAALRVILPEPAGRHIAPGARPGSRRYRGLAVAGVLPAVGLIAWAVIWAAYGFRYSAGPADTTIMAHPTDGPYLSPEAWKVDDWQRGPGLTVLLALRQWRLLPEAYLHGLVKVMYQETRRHGFLIGYDSYDGWWYYFPVALFLKTPVSMLAILGTGLALLLTGWWRAPDRWRQDRFGWPLVTALAVFCVVTMSSHFNIGLRHFLPVLPLLVLLAAVPLAEWARQTRANLIFVAALGVWQIAAAVWICPDFLCYFNVLVGGPGRGHEYLVDHDWGQDLPRLARFMQRHGIDSVKLATSGSAYPATYGVRAEWIPGSPDYPGFTEATLEPGTYVIGPILYQGINTKLTRLWMPGHESRYRALVRRAAHNPAVLTPQDRSMLRSLAFHRLLCRLRQRPPEFRVGYTMFVYNVSPQEFELVFPGGDAPIIRRALAYRRSTAGGRGLHPVQADRGGGT